jgi:hypothetical protein
MMIIKNQLVHVSTYLTCFFAVLPLINFMNCSTAADSKEPAAKVDRDEFNRYWYAGKAELTRYALEQARYGEIHPGEAVLIFVTEDFLTDKQVKHEFGDAKNAASVLKCNFVKKFYTGVYPYAMITSVFTPVATNQPTLKVSSSTQEWCGQTYSQINRHSNQLQVLLHSYFQNEADQSFELSAAHLEDEIWTKIRLAPGSLPTGEIKIIPGLQFARLRHVPLKVETAVAKLESTADKNLSANELQVYTIEYTNLKRTLAIKFEKEFPHRIIAWEETNVSGFGPDAKMLTTRAVKTHSIMSDYWNKHTTADSYLRKELGLSF